MKRQPSSRIGSTNPGNHLDIDYDADIRAVISQWKRGVHPRIVKLYGEGGSALNQLRPRADLDWSWLAIDLVTGVFGCFGYGLWVRARPDVHSRYLAGLIVVQRGYGPMTDDDGWWYVFYVTTIPRELCPGSALGASAPKNIAKLLLDRVLLDAVEERNPPKVWLHADPKGGDDLLRYYEDLGIAKYDGKINQFRRRQDARYFVFDAAQIETFLTQQDDLR